VQVDPANFFEHVFTERVAQLREQAELLRDELSGSEDADPVDGRADHDRG
jgi:hypothetical protein